MEFEKIKRDPSKTLRAQVFEEVGKYSGTSERKPGDKIVFRFDGDVIEKAVVRDDEPFDEAAFVGETEKVRRVGRKPKPESQRRRNRAILRFTDSEFREILNAVDTERELAEVVRELALEAARARNAQNAAE